MHNKTILKFVSPTVLATFSTLACASAFQLQEQNGSGVGNAFAGSAAVAEDASTIYFNPAGMTELQDRAFSFGGAYIKTDIKFSNDGTSSTGLLSGNGGNAGQAGFAPNLYASMAYNKDFRFGIGVGAPFAFVTEYDDSWLGGAQSVKFDLETLNVNPSAAYRLSDSLSIAAGLNWQRLDAEYKRIAAIGPTVTPFGVAWLNQTTLKMTLSDDGWGWNAGLLYKPTSGTRLGFSYRSEIKYSTTGEITASGDSTSVAALTASGNVAHVKADVTMPDSAIFSLSQRLGERLELLGDVSWTGWSSIPKVDIVYTDGLQSGTTAQTLRTDFRDTWRVALGGNYSLNDEWKLKFGVAYDQTPVKGDSTRLVAMPDNDRTWVSVGAQWKPTKQSAVDIGLAHLFLKDSGIHDNQGTRGYVSGTYQTSATVLGLQYSSGF